jgi:hypothetical protein
VLANSLEGVIVVFGVIGLIIGLKYVVLACALGRFVCGSAVSPSKFTFLFGCFVEVAYVTAAGCGIWLAAQSLGLATHLSAYVAWDSAFQISGAFLIAGLIINALAAPACTTLNGSTRCGKRSMRTMSTL